MYQFFNSNFFIALATILTGAVAIIIYFSQKLNTKVRAAKILISEIRIAEDRIEQIKDRISSGSISHLPTVFTTNSWKVYSNLFINDLDQDELALLNSFYDYGEQVEDFAKRNNDFFWINTEERGRVSVRKLVDYVDESFEDNIIDKDNYIKNKKDYLSHALDLYNTPYSPKTTLDEVNKYLSKIQKITITSCGVKLKKIAKLKN